MERAGPLLDAPVRPDAAARFLQSGDHHMLVAYEEDQAVGFVTGVEMTHPDKGTEMFLYELAVDAAYRNRGYGTALIRALAAIARERGCYGMWVLTDDDNLPALAAYEAAGGVRESVPVMLSWSFGGE